MAIWDEDAPGSYSWKLQREGDATEKERSLRIDAQIVFSNEMKRISGNYRGRNGTLRKATRNEATTREGGK